MSDRERLAQWLQEVPRADRFGPLLGPEVAARIAEHLQSRGVVLMPESGQAGGNDRVKGVSVPVAPASPASLSGLAAILKAVEEYGVSARESGDYSRTASDQNAWAVEARKDLATVQALVTQVCDRAIAAERERDEAIQGERQAIIGNTAGIKHVAELEAQLAALGPARGLLREVRVTILHGGGLGHIVAKIDAFFGETSVFCDHEFGPFEGHLSEARCRKCSALRAFLAASSLEKEGKP